MINENNIELEMLAAMDKDLAPSALDEATVKITTAIHKLHTSADVFKDAGFEDQYSALITIINKIASSVPQSAELKVVVADINNAFDNKELDVDFSDDFLDINLSDDELEILERNILKEMDFEDEID